MYQRFALMGVVLALTAAGGALAANPHAQIDLSLSQNGCTIAATGTWSSVRVARVDFYFITVGVNASMPVDPRPARSGVLAASADASPSQAAGRVTAVFVDPKGDYAGTLSQTYSLAGCV